MFLYHYFCYRNICIYKIYIILHIDNSVPFEIVDFYLCLFKHCVVPLGITILMFSPNLGLLLFKQNAVSNTSAFSCSFATLLLHLLCQCMLYPQTRYVTIALKSLVNTLSERKALTITLCLQHVPTHCPAGSCHWSQGLSDHMRPLLFILRDLNFNVSHNVRYSIKELSQFLFL